VAGTRHRWVWRGRLYGRFSATLSALALIVRSPPLASFAQRRMSPQRINSTLFGLCRTTTGMVCVGATLNHSCSPLVTGSTWKRWVMSTVVAV
jgi:hypothetical protein